MLSSIEVVVEHGLEVGIMSLVAWSLIVDGIGEEGIEAEADKEGLTDLIGSGGTSELE